MDETGRLGFVYDVGARQPQSCWRDGITHLRLPAQLRPTIHPARVADWSVTPYLRPRIRTPGSRDNTAVTVASSFMLSSKSVKLVENNKLRLGDKFPEGATHSWSSLCYVYVPSPSLSGRKQSVCHLRPTAVRDIQSRLSHAGGLQVHPPRLAANSPGAGPVPSSREVDEDVVGRSTCAVRRGPLRRCRLICLGELSSLCSGNHSCLRTRPIFRLQHRHILRRPVQTHSLLPFLLPLPDATTRSLRHSRQRDSLFRRRRGVA